jgi:peptide/nickel transport system substrate-binding protein
MMVLECVQRIVRPTMKLALAAAIAAPPLVAVPAAAKVLRWSFQSDVPELDPQARRVVFTRSFIANIMEPLTRYDKNLQIEPALAEKWELVQPDKWRFHLRRGVVFSDGTPFTADDVVATFKRGMDPKSPFRGVFAGVAGIDKVDDHTVDILTKGPYPILTRDLTDILIFSKSWLEANNALAPVDPTKGEESYTLRHAMGTGPFKLKSFQPDNQIVLEANPRWWNDANKEHNLTEVIFRPIKASSTRVAALLSNELDMIFPLSLQDVDRVAAAPGMKVVEGPDITTMYLGMRIGQDTLASGAPNPFKDPRVRQAVYRAIDIQAIVARVMRGKASEATVLMSPYHRGYDKRFASRVEPFDPEGAKKLLAAAGYPDGFKATMVCPNDRYVNDQQICLALVSMLAKVGIQIDLRAVPGARWLPMMNNAETDMWLAAWTAVGTIDAHSYLHAIVHTPDGSKGGFNPGRYSNPKVDALEAQIAREADDAKRNELIYEAFSIHRQELGQIPLLQPKLIWAMRSNVDLVQLANSNFDLRWVRVK